MALIFSVPEALQTRAFGIEPAFSLEFQRDTTLGTLAELNLAHILPLQLPKTPHLPNSFRPSTNPLSPPSLLEMVLIQNYNFEHESDAFDGYIFDETRHTTDLRLGLQYNLGLHHRLLAGFSFDARNRFDSEGDSHTHSTPLWVTYLYDAETLRINANVSSVDTTLGRTSDLSFGFNYKSPFGTKKPWQAYANAEATLNGLSFDTDKRADWSVTAKLNRQALRTVNPLFKFPLNAFNLTASWNKSEEPKASLTMQHKVLNQSDKALSLLVDANNEQGNETTVRIGAMAAYSLGPSAAVGGKLFWIHDKGIETGISYRKKIKSTKLSYEFEISSPFDTWEQTHRWGATWFGDAWSFTTTASASWSEFKGATTQVLNTTLGFLADEGHHPELDFGFELLRNSDDGTFEPGFDINLSKQF